MPTPAMMEERCTQCDAAGPLLASDDENGGTRSGKLIRNARYCNNCMIGKSVRVYWPVDSSWYTGKVQGFNPDTGEHLLKYPDNDEEWVRIGDMRQAQLPPSMGGPAGGASDNDLQGSGGIVPKRRPMMSPMQSPPPPAPDTAPSNPNNNSGGVAPGGGGAPLSPKWLGPDATGMPPIYFPYQGAPPPPHHSGMPMSGGHGGMYMGYGGAGGPPPVPYHHPMVYHHSLPNIGLDNDAASANDPSGRNKKQGPKPWSKEEDTCLSGLVRTMQWPIKWTMVAQSLAGRTGKQCRERYVNHLNPRLKTSEWSPVEDATIFHLYNTLGSHWAKMSKIIPGRTDNGIKNRFHNIRRQYEREDSHRLRLNSVHDFPDDIRLDRLRKFPDHLSGKATNLWNMESAVGVLAAQSVKTAVPRDRLGPFVIVTEPTLCVRCGLLVPSVHTGAEVCEKTGWCASCVRVPPNVSGNLLRECLNLRRAPDDLRKVVEGWDELFQVTEENAWPYNNDDESSPEDDVAGEEKSPSP